MNVKKLLYFFWALISFALNGESLSAKIISPRESLTNSQKYFDRGYYGEAVKSLSKLSITRDFDNADDMKQALKIRAISYCELKEKAQAIDSIKELLSIDPKFRFDPFETPKEVLEIAADEIKLIEEKNEKLANIGNENLSKVTENIDLSPPPAQFKNEKGSLTYAFLPFGINHFYKKSFIKGSIYSSLEAAGLIANIGAFWWKQNYLDSFGSSRLNEGSQKKAFDLAQTIQYIGLGLFLGAFTASVVDALVEYFRFEAQNS